MLINGSFMIEQQLFISAVRDSHDVDVLEFGASFAPIAMRQNMMTPDLAARFHFATRRATLRIRSTEPTEVPPNF